HDLDKAVGGGLDHDLLSRAAAVHAVHDGRGLGRHVGRSSFLGNDMLAQAIVAEDAAGAGLQIDGCHAPGIAGKAERPADVEGIADVWAADIGAAGRVAREGDFHPAANRRLFDAYRLRHAVQHGYSSNSTSRDSRSTTASTPSPVAQLVSRIGLPPRA